MRGLAVAHSLTHSLTHALTHLFTHSLGSHSLTHDICNPPELWDIRASKTLKENKELMLVPFLDEFKTLSHEEVRKAAEIAKVPDYSLILLSLIDKGFR